MSCKNLSNKNFYKVFANLETHYIYARNDDIALRLIRKRLMERFGRCKITDIHIKNFKNERWERLPLKRNF